jgi:hypothetical protein
MKVGGKDVNKNVVVRDHRPTEPPRCFGWNSLVKHMHSMQPMQCLV